MAVSEGILTAIIGAAGAVAGAGLSAAGASAANRRAYKWSKKFFDYQNEYNLANYSPAMNMERLREAGINPHELAGSPGSGLSAQGSMSVPEYQNPIDPIGKSIPAAIQTAINLYTQSQQLKNSTDLVKSQIERNEAETNKTNYQVANIMPHESEFAKNKSVLPLYQAQAYGLQAQKLMQDLSLFSMTKQKYQLALDLMEIEKKYADEYHKYRNESVKWDYMIKKSESGIRALDLKNYTQFGLRPQDPYYYRAGANIVDQVKNKGFKGLWQDIKDWFSGD